MPGSRSSITRSAELTITIVVVVLALVIGLLANRFLRSRITGEDAGGITAQDLILPDTLTRVHVLCIVSP